MKPLYVLESMTLLVDFHALCFDTFVFSLERSVRVEGEAYEAAGAGVQAPVREPDAIALAGSYHGRCCSGTIGREFWFGGR